MDGLHVVPSLLEEGDEEVEGHHDVDTELFISHSLGTNSGGEAGDLLELPLNGGTDVLYLLADGVVVGNDLGEHLDSVKDGSNNDGNLLEDGIGSDKEGVFLGPALNELLVLVELLEVIKIDNIDINLSLGNLVLVLLVGNNADLEVGAGVVGETDGTDKSLILLGIVVLKSNLELNSFLELAGLHDRAELGDSLSNGGVVNLCGHTN